MYISFRVYFKDDLIEGEQAGSLFNACLHTYPDTLKRLGKKKKSHSHNAKVSFFPLYLQTILFKMCTILSSPASERT